MSYNFSVLSLANSTSWIECCLLGASQQCCTADQGTASFRLLVAGLTLTNIIWKLDRVLLPFANTGQGAVSWLKPGALPQPPNWSFSQSTPLLDEQQSGWATTLFSIMWVGHGLSIEPAHAPIKSFLPPFYPHVISYTRLSSHIKYVPFLLPRIVRLIFCMERRAWGQGKDNYVLGLSCTESKTSPSTVKRFSYVTVTG